MNMLEGNRDSKKIIILMATYNGENHLAEQLDSIINQSYTNWHMIIRDDESTDSTPKIIKDYAERESRISVFEDDNGNGGQCKNFDSLMKFSLAQYVETNNTYFMFADQDDFWYDKKIQASLEEIVDIEKEVGRSLPILVYTNYMQSDTNLQNLKKVYTSDMNFRPRELASRLLIQNWVMGCTTIINLSLLKVSIEIPKEAENHDNWMAKLCSLVGHIGYIHEPTMIHRIHSSNVTTSTNTTNYTNRIKRVLRRIKNNKELFRIRHQLMKAIEIRTKGIINEEMTQLLLEYNKMLGSGKMTSLKIAYKNNFFAVNRLQTFLFYTQLLLSKLQ